MGLPRHLQHQVVTPRAELAASRARADRTDWLVLVGVVVVGGAVLVAACALAAYLG